MSTVRHILTGKRIVIAIYALAVALRLLAVVVYVDTDPQTANLWEYGQEAKNFIQHGTVSYVYFEGTDNEFIAPSSLMPPGLVLLWIALFKAFGISRLALTAMLILNLILGVLIVHLTYRIAQLVTKNEKVALITLIIISFYPTFVYAVSTYHALNAYLALFLLSVYLLFLSADNPKLLYIAALGIIAGLMPLFRANFLIYAALIGICILWLSKSLKKLLLYASLALLVIAPWTIRNYIVFGDVIVSANSLGYNFWRGHNDFTKGSGETDTAYPIPPHITQKINALPRDKTFEKARDKIFLAEVLHSIRANPLRELSLVPRKLLLFWLFEVYDEHITHRLSYVIPHFLTLLFFILGLAFAADTIKLPYRRLFYLVFFIETLVCVAFFVLTRYRMTIEPFLFIFSAAGMNAVLERLPHARLAQAAHTN